jgi:lipooligosaccharide transport system ATP-binding protein
VLVRARGLTKRFGDFTAVDGIDFDLYRGEAFGFLGPNGAAEGSPRDLITRYCSPEVLELRFDPELHDLAADKLKDFRAERIEVLADRILLYVTDGDAALAAIRSSGLEPLTSLVRRGTLEDVFLRLTGRRLED